jgi:ubiquinone/menaquinone biosynthesis C-methylase UbiE
LKANNVNITVVNFPPPPPPQHYNNELFTLKKGDGCNLSEFGDHSFHIAHSNSVIEHVGNWDKKVMFAKELRRVAKKYYLQTPNYWFPMEPHFMTPFFHWLPKKVRIKLTLWFKLGWFPKAKNYEKARQNVESCSLLTKKELLKLFPDSSLYKEKFICWTKSLIVKGIKYTTND